MNILSPWLAALALVPALHFLTQPNRASMEMYMLPFSYKNSKLRLYYMNIRQCKTMYYSVRFTTSHNTHLKDYNKEYYNWTLNLLKPKFYILRIRLGLKKLLLVYLYKLKQTLGQAGHSCSSQKELLKKKNSKIL